VADGSHTLWTQAYDTAGNRGDSAIVTVTALNAGIDVSGWRIVQANSSYTFYLPLPTRVPDNGYLVIARSANRAAFEAFWGVTLGSNVVFVNSGDALPIVNGDENYTLYNASGSKVDGRTASMPSTAGRSFQRKDPCLAASKSGSWNVLADSLATPGRGAAAGCGKGVVINEFSDASGTGNFVYEFIELHYDR